MTLDHLKSVLTPKPIVKNIGNVVGLSTGNMNYKTKTVSILPKGCITSEEPYFFVFVKNAMAVLQLSYTNSQINQVLAILDSDGKATIYVDNFPLLKSVILNKGKPKLPALVYESEIEDIIDVKFKDDFVDITPNDGSKVLCLIREGFAFILFWDFTGTLKQSDFCSTLAAKCSMLTFPSAYDFYNKKSFLKFIKYGWYPFAGLTEGELRYLVTRGGQPTKLWLKKLLPQARLDNMLDMWLQKETFKQKEPILRSAINNFLKGDHIASIKILVTEIEGLISVAYSLEKNKKLTYKDKEVCKYLAEKAGRLPRNRLNHIGFIEYLSKSIYRHGMTEQNRNQLTRHSTTHGRADNAAYDLERNIQIILTINQLFYYL